MKEKVNSNKYLQKLTPLKKEKLKVLKILDQLTELKENKGYVHRYITYKVDDLICIQLQKLKLKPEKEVLI